MKKSALVISLFALALLTQRCTVDDLSVCGLNLTFTYDYNTSATDKFSTDVSTVDVYVFDENGALVDKFIGDFSDHKRNSMKLYLDSDKFHFPGSYTFVAWGEIENRLFDVANSQDNLSMSVSLSTPASVLNYTDEPDRMFFGRIDNVELNRTNNARQNISLMNNVKNITVTARGLPYAAAPSVEPEFEISIQANNRAFNNTDNLTPAARAAGIKYKCDYDYSGQSSHVLVSNFNILRVFVAGDDASRLVVTTYNAGKIDTLFDQPLTELLLAPMRAKGTHLPAEVQDSLDRGDHFDIDLTFDRTYNVVNIVVDDYQVNSNGGPLG